MISVHWCQPYDLKQVIIKTKKHCVGSRACAAPFFHIYPINKGLGDEEEPTHTPSPSPPPRPVVDMATKSSDRRRKQEDLFARGIADPLIKSKTYHARKCERNNARKEWVFFHGLEVPVPQSLWPKEPNGDFKPWCPPEHWLTEAQADGPCCSKYVQQLELMSAHYSACLPSDDEPTPEQEEIAARPWKSSSWWSSSSSSGWDAGWTHWDEGDA